MVAAAPDVAKLHSSAAWQDNHVFHNIPCRYEQYRDQVDRELAQMRRHGQRKVALMLWFAPLDQNQDCAGFLLNSRRGDGGEFGEQVISNLKWLIADARRLGFDELQLRFAPMDGADPRGWRSWDEPKFRQNWNTIRSTIAGVGRPGGIRLVYDLGVELGGLTKGCAKQYVERAWTLFNGEFTGVRSYGFSIALAPGRVAELVRDLRAAGPIPGEIAIDDYDVADPGLAYVAKELEQTRGPASVIVQEAPYADTRFISRLRTQAVRYRVRIRTVMQWPLRSGRTGPISESSTPDFLYAPAAPQRAADAPSR
ncbi:MAG TPA: hypothetical protein VGS12_11865 [Caulobacteraceae bacterium]|nr:hypothetical protein [Caulobacteraceae bacterium]